MRNIRTRWMVCGLGIMGCACGAADGPPLAEAEPEKTPTAEAAPALPPPPTPVPAGVAVGASADTGVEVDTAKEATVTSPEPPAKDTAPESPPDEGTALPDPEAPKDTGEAVVRAPTAGENPFDNPEKFDSHNSSGTPADADAEFDPTRPMKVPLEFSPPGETLPYPMANPRQYKGWRQRGKMRVGHSHLDQVCLSPDEQHVLAMSENEGTVRIYDVNTRKLVNNYSILGTTSFSSFDVLFWPVVEKEPLVLFAKKNGLMLYRALVGEPHAYLLQIPTSEIRWSDDFKTLVGYGREPKQKGTVITFYRRKSPAELEIIRQVPTTLNLRELDISRDNRLLAVAATPNVVLYSLETGEALWQQPAPSAIWSVDISPDGTKVAWGGSHLIIADIENPDRQTKFTKFNNNINRVRFSPSGDAVFVSSYDGHIRVVSSDLSKPTGTLLKKLRHGGTANVYEMDFSKDGSMMVSVSGDQTVRIWGRTKR